MTKDERNAMNTAAYCLSEDNKFFNLMIDEEKSLPARLHLQAMVKRNSAVADTVTKELEKDDNKNV